VISDVSVVFVPAPEISQRDPGGMYAARRVGLAWPQCWMKMLPVSSLASQDATGPFVA
jgi:hypothetical protein